MAAVVGSIDCARFLLQPWPGPTRLSSYRPLHSCTMAFIRTTTFRNHQNRFSGRHYKEQGGEGGGRGRGGALAGISPVTACVVQYARGRGRGWRGIACGHDCAATRLFTAQRRSPRSSWKGPIGGSGGNNNERLYC